MKYKYYFSFNLCVIFFQTPTKLLGHKNFLVYLDLYTYMRHLVLPKGAVKIQIEAKFGNLWLVPCGIKDTVLTGFPLARLVSTHIATVSL